MQGRIAEAKERISNLRVQGDAGGGMVTVTMSGAMRMVECKIDPALAQSGDKEMLEDLVVAATNQAMEKLNERQAEEMKSITGGIDMPGMADALKGMGLS